VCVVFYEQVRARVNAKYDAWQLDILSRFGVKLGNAMKEMHASILKVRNDLEHRSIEGLVAVLRVVCFSFLFAPYISFAICSFFLQLLPCTAEISL
jgi:hypothetical protein